MTKNIAQFAVYSFQTITKCDKCTRKELGTSVGGSGGAEGRWSGCRVAGLDAATVAPGDQERPPRGRQHEPYYRG